MLEKSIGPAPECPPSARNEAAHDPQKNNTTGGGGNQAFLAAPVYPYYLTHKHTKPSRYVSLAAIVELARDINIGPKETAPAITPFHADAKTADAAATSEFYAQVNDHDHDNLTREGIKALYDGYGVAYLAFTTSSHRQPKKGVVANRWKVVVPFAEPINHVDFVPLAVGAALVMGTDKAQARIQQVFYAPNITRGSNPFDYIDATDRPPLNPHDPLAPFVSACLAAYQQAEKEQRQQADQAPAKPRANVPDDGGIIEKVCKHYTMHEVLVRNGYRQVGGKYLSPNSESGNPGVVILGGSGKERVYSHHGESDPLSHLNHTSRRNDRGHSLDVFDAVCHLEHGGDVEAAVRNYANLLDPHGQKARQRQHMAEKAAESQQENQENNETVAAVDLFGNMEQPPFPVDLFPPVVADFAKDQAELMGVDPAIICMAALGALAGCIDDRLQIQPKRYDPTWRESARLWIGIIGDPATKKSPGMKKAISPANRVAAEWRKKHAEAVQQWEDECEKLKTDDKKAKLPPKPAAKRLTVSDSTVEKLGEILAGMEPRGILVDRDELTGWLNSMDAYKNGGGKDRAAWLEAYNGGGQEVDRIQRGSLWVPNWSACVVGGIQPQVIQGYAKVTNHDGMLQRLILVHAAPAKPGIDRRPDMEAKKAYSDLVEQLACLQPTDEPVKLSDGAHAVRAAFNDKLHRATVNLPNPHLAAMLGKWEGTFARVLLTFHVAECAARREYPTEKQVPEQTARNVAALLWRVLLPHAIRFYDGLDATESHAKSLAGLLLARGWERFTVKRDLHNNMIAFRKMMEWEREEMLDRLAAYGWIFPEQGKINERGKPSAYLVNPDIHRRFTGQAEREKQRRAEVAKIMADLKRTNQDGM
ncbi:DUF3987 domain-containing protein [Desulfurivibrio sp. C05AmB]|uniref:DUF3987 domain-containing protein n=1 Tax=Desulfurivibrio sp. C05AmB TaxID=3374371 RepID=UPI00376F39B5